MTPWVDSHCHLFMAEESPALLLERALAAGVAWVMCPGTGLAESLAARAAELDRREGMSGLDEKASRTS